MTDQRLYELLENLEMARTSTAAAFLEIKKAIGFQRSIRHTLLLSLGWLIAMLSLTALAAWYLIFHLHAQQ